TSDDGLVQNSIEAILQDRHGFMWFGTSAGLSRYDGYHFTNFQHDVEDTASLSESHIRSLYEDKDGLIWVGTEGGGVDRFDPITGSFKTYVPKAGDPTTIGGDRILNIFQDSKRNLWFGGPRLFGVSRFDPATERFTRYRMDGADAAGPLPGGNVGGVVEGEPGQIWIIADSVLLNFDLSKQTFTNYPLPQKNETRLTGLLKDSNGA